MWLPEAVQAVEDEVERELEFAIVIAMPEGASVGDRDRHLCRIRKSGRELVGEAGGLRTGIRGKARPGTFAEYAVVPGHQVGRKPAAISFEEAAASVMTGLTALIAMRDVGQVCALTGMRPDRSALSRLSLSAPFPRHPRRGFPDGRASPTMPSSPPGRYPYHHCTSDASPVGDEVRRLGAYRQLSLQPVLGPSRMSLTPDEEETHDDRNPRLELLALRKRLRLLRAGRVEGAGVHA